MDYTNTWTKLTDRDVAINTRKLFVFQFLSNNRVHYKSASTRGKLITI